MLQEAEQTVFDQNQLHFTNKQRIINKYSSANFFNICNLYNIRFIYYRGIILIRDDQCSWIVKILVDRCDVIPWVIDLLHYNKGQFISLLNNRGDLICGQGPSRTMMIPQYLENSKLSDNKHCRFIRYIKRAFESQYCKSIHIIDHT